MGEVDIISGFVPPDIEQLNQWLSKYEVINLIACGGMGAVYQARQIALDRLVAIKILPPELAVNEVFRKSFEAEGKAMAKVAHPNLVGVFDLGKISDMLFLVIEYVEGSNLHESKGDSAIDPETAVTLICSVSSGLAEAHGLGMVHRDIKPANILINTDLVPKLGDFGLAVPDSDIESGLMMGTPAYLAPEILANPASASFSSDTYALGVILYEMLTGSSIERGDVMDLTRVPAIGDLKKIVSKAVDPKPLLRYQDGADFETALNEWIKNPKGSTVATPMGGGIKRPNIAPPVSQVSSGGGGLWIGLVALLVMGGLAWAFLGSGSDSDPVSDNVNPDSSVPVSDPLLDTMVLPEASHEEILEGFRSGQQAALREIGTRISQERAQNRQEFLQAAGKEGADLLKLVPSESAVLPRYFLPGEVEISNELLIHLNKFANSRDREINREFRKEISSLHRDSIRALRASKEELPEEVSTSWHRWVEWLGEDPVKIMHTSIAGLWKLNSRSDKLELHLSSTGQQLLMIGEERIEGDDLIEVNEVGEISLKPSAARKFRFPWKLRWQGYRLAGEDAQGGSRFLKLNSFNYASLLKESKGEVVPSVEMPEDSPAADTSSDPKLEALTQSYRKALSEKIEPLDAGYRRVLEGLRNQLEGEAVEQVEEELAWVKGLDWRAGLLNMSILPVPVEVPAAVTDKQKMFRDELMKRYEPIQRTYLSSLQKMLRQRITLGDENIGELKRTLGKLEGPEGAVRARYVKLVSLEEGDLKHTLVTELEILDSEGENLSRRDFTDITVSSFATNGDGLAMSGELIFDGDSETWWHSSWSSEERGFPHWISFDLGRQQLISGFSITSRSYRKNRRTGLTNWVFYVSADGENWSKVGKGTFPREDGLKTHLGFKDVE